ncbi:MAG TPA: hypothetical protein VNO50_10420 [Pyrinomonadaceae bacterium]|nr:hypothetical protein [Pyrinomonadaceae bacterium]
MPNKKIPSAGSKGAKTPPAKTSKNAATRKAVVQPAKSTRAQKKRAAEFTGLSTDVQVGTVGSLGHILVNVDKLAKPKLRVSCVRPDDLLVCDFIFENLILEREGEGAPKLVRSNPDASATLVVEFPPQSFGEQAFLDKTGESIPSTPPEEFPEKSDAIDPQNVKPQGDVAEKLPPMPSAKIRMSGPSRIAFTMPARTELPFTIEAILDACRKWPMRFNVNATGDPLRQELLTEFGHRDRWLTGVVESESWSRTGQGLIEVIGEHHKRSIAGAARRLARQTIEAIRSRPTAATKKALSRAFDEELDILAQRSRTLSEPGRREIAGAALAMMTTEALAGVTLDRAVFDVFDKLPFLPMLFAPYEPPPNVTALELPYRLIISPVPSSRWHHGTVPVVHNGRTELWHTRLTSNDKDKGPDGPTRIRALWSPDYIVPNIIDKVNNNLPFRMSLDPLDRKMLVRLTAGFQEEAGNPPVPYRPLTVGARRLSLSSLGALLDAEGSWAPPVPDGVGLQQWRHLATLGRDHYVRVVYRGFLMPLGHAASLVKVTERKFEFLLDAQGNPTSNRVAVLRQRFYIIVRERVKSYTGTGHEFEGRNFPFTSVEILTRVTPSLVAPDKPECKLFDPENIIYNGATGVPRRACFWPMINATNNFMFQIAATDRAGDCVSFATPLLFVGVEANEHESAQIMQQIILRYDAESPNPRRFAFIGGASVCYAPVDPDAKGDTRCPTTHLIFRAAPMLAWFKTNFKEQPQFYPEAEEGNVGITAMRRLLQKPDVNVTVKYAEAYVKPPGGFGATNPGEVFLTLKTPLKLEFGDQQKSDAIGGIATPSMTILGLSRVMGPVSSKAPTGSETADSKLQKIVDNEFDPIDFFPDAKILGGVNLKDVLEKVTTGLAGPSVPKLLSREVDGRVEASFDWTTTEVKEDPAGLFVPHYQAQTKLTMQGVVSAPLDGSAAPTFNVAATLDHFRVNLFGFVTLWFDRLKFAAQTGAKPDVSVDLHPGDRMIEFGGPLEFVNELRKIIPSDGFSDPPALSVTPSGISASYSVNIPSLAVGILALEHLSVGAGFLLPFDARPAEVRFNFAERQRPFSLTVSLLGGGGFFAIGIGTEGVREIEAALEFGAALSISLGVASGSVEIKAGIYFHWKTQTVELAGYVRLHGELSVLGLISASLTFNLQLAYLKENGRSVVWGEASIEVEIDILFLSFSVSVSCRREFGGSDGDPKFAQLITDQSTWDDYCEAFAAEAA